MKKVITLFVIAAAFTAHAENYSYESKSVTPIAGGQMIEYKNVERRTLNVPVPTMDLPAVLSADQQPVFTPEMDLAQIEDILNKQLEALEAYMNARIKAAEEMYARNEFQRDMMSKYEFEQLTKMQVSKETALSRMQARRDAMLQAMRAKMGETAPSKAQKEAPATEKAQ
jgi:hypothetical protein